MHIFYDGKKEKNMCGIVGYIGSKEKTLDVLLNGLTNLEYRGYDSAGIAYFNEDELKIVKSVGRIQKLRDKVMKESALLGIGHTRWATHGEANEKNSHPHHVGQITIVHNGIIENYEQLRKDLIQKGYQFQSDTDTEVACALLDYYYNEHKNIEYAIEECLKELEGSYALGILVNGDENLYAVKNKSPLIIGTGNQEYYIASDVPAILEETNQYIVLEDKEFSRISKDGITVYNQKGEIVSKEIKEFKGDSLSAKKDGYSHFMEKEMYEEPKVFKRISEQYVQDNLDYFITKIPDFSKYEKIDIVACGSAYHAGLVGKNLIEEYAIVPVNVEDVPPSLSFISTGISDKRYPLFKSSTVVIGSGYSCL
jgi:glutamine---fructose-6-phosphate transaminase (isomerizing)